MSENSARESVIATMIAINRTWLENRPEALSSFFHPDVIMVFPGFEGRAQGRDALIAGFVDFCTNAKVHEYREDDMCVDLIGTNAVLSFRYEMVYERSGEAYRAFGRDLWVFANHEGSWLAVWRTMFDVSEHPELNKSTGSP